MIEDTGWVVVSQQGIFTGQLHVLADVSKTHAAMETETTVQPMKVMQNIEMTDWPLTIILVL